MSAEIIIVSYSELDTFRQCPLKHHLLYGMRWTRPVKEGSALDKGSFWHLIMETHYRRIKAWQDENGGKPIPEAWEEKFLLELYEKEIVPLLWDGKRGEWISPTAELIDWMYKGHVSMWGCDSEWKILGIEHQIITPLRDPRGRRSRYHLKAKMDLIIQKRRDGGRWVVDHKSGGNLPTQMDLEIDDQFGLYTWAMREVGRRVTGSLHNAARTQRNKSPMTLESRMSRTHLNRSEKELTNLALDAYHCARAAYPPKGHEARYSSPDPRSCGWKCDIKEPHLLMRQGRPVQEVMVEYGFKINRTRH
jgi:hypothetical protein